MTWFIMNSPPNERPTKSLQEVEGWGANWYNLLRDDDNAKEEFTTP